MHTLCGRESFQHDKESERNGTSDKKLTKVAKFQGKMLKYGEAKALMSFDTLL